MKVVVERKTGMDFQFESFSHAKTYLRYHLVFTTKYRRSALAGIEDRVYRTFREVEDVSEFTILEMGCDLGNHIHLLVTLRPALSIEQVVRRLKQMSTRKLWEMEPDHLSRFYWAPSAANSGPPATSAPPSATPTTTPSPATSSTKPSSRGPLALIPEPEELGASTLTPVRSYG